MTSTKLDAIPAIGLVLAGLLTGCANTSQRTMDTPTQTATTAATPTAVATPSAMPVAVTTPGPVPVGGTVAAGLKTVSLSDGTNWAIDPAQPLPETVKADLAKPLVALLADTASKHNVSSAAVDAQAGAMKSPDGSHDHRV